ncbi:MAG: hypothetical protein JEY79_17905 [Pseudodesulfovibrio sp.]|nr:hypothetical protein [Pseudodesulfovibrio sp.]
MRQTIAIVRNRKSIDYAQKNDPVHKQVSFISRLLRELGWNVVDVEVDPNLKKFQSFLREMQPDIIFNLVDTFMGSGEMANLMTSIFSNLRIPFTGTDSTVFAMTNDKLTTKWHLIAAGLLTPEGVDEKVLFRGCFPGPGRYIIKSRFDHSSLELNETSVVHADNAHMLFSALENNKLKLGAACIVERFIAGREFSVSIAESSAGKGFVFGIAEIIFSEKKQINIVEYKSLWKTASLKKQITPESFFLKKPTTELTQRIERKAIDCWEELGLCGYARIVFRIDEEGKLYIIDVSPNPNLSKDGAFLSTAKIGGWTSPDVISMIVDGAMFRHQNKYKYD